MTDLLELQPGEKVLEIGTGSGYQAAILAELGLVDVYSIEIVPELSSNAAQRLQSLGYEDLNLMQTDSCYSWPITLRCHPRHGCARSFACPAKWLPKPSDFSKHLLRLGPFEVVPKKRDHRLAAERRKSATLARKAVLAHCFTKLSSNC